MADTQLNTPQGGYRSPFDIRLRRVLVTSGIYGVGDNASKKEEWKDTGSVSQMPLSYYQQDGEYNVDLLSNGYTRSGDDIRALKSQTASADVDEMANKLDQSIEKLKSNPYYYGVTSVMNPFAFTHLFGAEGGKFYVDTRDKRKYYETDGDESGHYASNPTTSNIIKWGSQDIYGRRVYSFQDFVFCKHWNVISNNRLITLRRFTQPTYDNLNFPDMESGTITCHPVATALTYFGDGTENTLSDILSFTAKYNWQEKKGDVWEATAKAPEMSQVESATGWDKVYSSGVATMSTVLGLMGRNTPGGNEHFDFDEAKGLPPDPYNNGPYENRILGPVNCINKTWARDRGLEFTNSIKLNFHYVSRPIGGINCKALLLDILANLLVMAYGSGVWWGGAHRFMVDPVKYPFTDNEAMHALWKGKILGKDGAPSLLVNNFQEKMTQGMGGDGVGNIFGSLGDAVKSLMGDLFGTLGMDSAANLFSGNVDKNGKGSNMAKNAELMFAANIQTKAGTLPYLHGMKAILTGEPVGDWHLVVGNPMNPIAEIGNLICKGITIKFSDELGPDDFPIGFTATIELDHAMGRDRDGIEAMFNKGAGRIYDLPDKYSSSADGQSVVDNATGVKGRGTFHCGGGPKIPAASRWGSSGTADNVVGPYPDAYGTVGTPSYIPKTVNINQMLYGSDMANVTHRIMPWQTKIVL